MGRMGFYDPMVTARTMVLECLRQKGEAAGRDVQRWVEQRSGGVIAPDPSGAYATIAKLVTEGLVERAGGHGLKGDSTTYMLTEAGKTEAERRAQIIVGLFGCKVEV